MATPKLLNHSRLRLDVLASDRLSDICQQEREEMEGKRLRRLAGQARVAQSSTCFKPYLAWSANSAKAE